MAEIEIEYCVSCGLLPIAETAQHALLEEFGQGVNALRMRPGHGGVFKVRLNGEVIFDKAREGFDPAEIVRRVGARIGA